MSDSLERRLQKQIGKALNSAVKFQGVCFRNVGQYFANKQDILSAKGSYAWGGRYNLPGEFGVLYLSCDLHTCLGELEYAAKYEGVDAAEKLPRTFTGVRLKLTKVLDLTDIKVRRQLKISRKTLTIDWAKENARGLEAPTQIIGRVARRAGFDALLVPSARATGKNLNLLDDDNLLSRTSIINVNLLPSRRRPKIRKGT